MILETKGVSKNFGSLAALSDVTFSVEKGEIFGIVGPNGAGKSTLFNVVAGHYRPSAGQVYFDRQNITKHKAHQVCQAGLARTFQTPKTIPSLSVYENINLGSTFGGNRNKNSEEIIRWLKLESVAQAPAQNLELYTTKLVMLGAALATGCKLLMLDEPMAGLTMIEINNFLDLVREANAARGITVIIIEHLLDILIGMTGRMLVLDNGKMIYLGNSDKVTQDQQVVDIYLGKKRRRAENA